MPASKAVAAPTTPEKAPAMAALSAEDRFMQALQKMLGVSELTEDGMRDAIAKLTPEQRQQLLAEGQDMKKDIMTKKENTEERKLYLKEVNRSADENGMPVDKDSQFLGTKVVAFMQTSSDDIPHSQLLEWLAATPYLVKAALTEARDASASAAVAADLNEVEAALQLLRVPGWREGEATATTRPPYVRRNLLLLLLYLHRERLRAIPIAESTVAKSHEVVAKSRRLLDVFFAFSMQSGWTKAVLATTELQALLVNGLWDHADDDCHSLMKQKLHAVGLKMPRISVRATCKDVTPGEKVVLKVEVARAHAFSKAEAEAYSVAQKAEQAEEARVAG